MSLYAFKITLEGGNSIVGVSQTIDEALTVLSEDDKRRVKEGSDRIKSVENLGSAVVFTK